MAKITYFHAGKLSKAGLKSGITVTKRTLTTQFDAVLPKGMTLRGHLIRGTEAAYKKWRGLTFSEPRDFMLLRNGDDCKLLVNPLMEACGIVIDDKTGFLKEVPEASEELARVLKPLAGATNRLIRVTFETALQVPRPMELQTSKEHSGLLDIVIGASPLGAAEEVNSKTLCGIRLDQKGYYLLHSGPAMGRGIILNDEDGNSFAQVLDGVIYLLLPVRMVESFRLLDSKSGPGLFKRAFVPAWNALIAPTAEQRPKRSNLSTAEAIEVYSVTTIVAQDAGNQVLLDEKKRRVQKTLKMYQEALRELETFRVFTAAGAARVAEDVAQIAEDWKRLLTHPQVNRVYAENEVIYVETHPLHLTYADKSYRIGAFTIRLSQFDGIGVWCEKSPHPRGISHPHISGEGAVCFGNVTRSINEDLVQSKIGSVTETILRWLTEGYEPTRADTKIEEWPLVKGKAP